MPSGVPRETGLSIQCTVTMINPNNTLQEVRQIDIFATFVIRDVVLMNIKKCLSKIKNKGLHLIGPLAVLNKWPGKLTISSRNVRARY